MLGLNGLWGSLLAALLGLIIVILVIWLLLPAIFKYIVAPYFDGSYSYKKDNLKRFYESLPAALPDQDTSITLTVDEKTGEYTISFGDKREYTKGGVEIFYNNTLYSNFTPDLKGLKKWYKYRDRTSGKKIPCEKYGELEFIGMDRSEEETPLGPFERISLNWSAGDGALVLSTEFLIPKDEDKRDILLFRTVFHNDKEISGFGTGIFSRPSINFPVFINGSYNRRIFTYKDIVFCPGTRDFTYTNGPLCLFDDNRNAAIISSFNHHVTNIIVKRPLKETIRKETGPSIDKYAYEILCGINGEVQELPAGHEHYYALVIGKGINNTFKKWGDYLMRFHGLDRDVKGKYRDHDLKYLGYYTDNGAYYYYRPIKGLGYDGTLLKVKEYADKEGIPIKYYHLDSWWYQKSVKKATRTILGPFGRLIGGALYGGTVLWEPDPEVFKIKPDTEHNKSILEILSEKFGGLPFTAHNRWYSKNSPYVKKYRFIIEGNSAMPKNDPEFWNEIMDNCRKFNIITYEQDWLKTHVSKFLFLRSEINAAHLWLNNMANAAEKRDVAIEYCMSTPAIVMESTYFKSVITARASGDYNPRWPKRYDTPYFLQSSMLMYACGLWPFKDTFQSTPTGPISGERAPVLMGLLSNLSGSLVAPGDKIGQINKEIVNAICRKDGWIYKPDRPITACDITYIKNRKYYLAKTYSTHGPLRWFYVIAINLWPSRVKEKYYTPEDLDIFADLPADSLQYGSGQYLCYNWFDKKIKIVDKNDEIHHELKYEEFVYEIYCPVITLKNAVNVAIIGDSSKYISMNDTEFSGVMILDDGFSLKLRNIAGETSELLIYSDCKPSSITVDNQKLNIENAAAENEYAKVYYDEHSHLLNVKVLFESDGEEELEKEIAINFRK